MPFDINDEETKLAIEKINAAHEADIAGLKKKNSELIGKLKKSPSVDIEEYETLNSKLEEAFETTAKLKRELEKSNKEKESFKSFSEKESAFSSKLLADYSLTEALSKASVAKEFQPAVKALFSSMLQIKQDGDSRSVFIGEKSLSDFVAEWSQSDEGKNFVTAPRNSGGNASGGKADGNGGKVINRATFDGMNQSERSAFFREGGKVES